MQHTLAAIAVAVVVVDVAVVAAELVAVVAVAVIAMITVGSMQVLLWRFVLETLRVPMITVGSNVSVNYYWRQ